MMDGARRGALSAARSEAGRSLEIERRQDDRWWVNGRPAPDLDGLVHLDLGFTPATNPFPLRRLALLIGESADAAAAWLDDERWVLRRLLQRYQRRRADAWWYESPEAGCQGLLRVNSDGYVTDQPGLADTRHELPAAQRSPSRIANARGCLDGALVRIRSGRMRATDGPFAEAKEVLGGFDLIDAADMEEAVRIAAGFPWARTGCVEVRPVREIASVRRRVGAA
jgi:hypothetical protein